MRAPRRFDAILFDVGGVFLLPDPRTTGPVLAPFGGALEAPVLVRAHYAGMAAQDRHGFHEESWRAYWVAYAAAAGVGDSRRERAAEALMAIGGAVWSHAVHERTGVLRELEARGVAVGIVSNAAAGLGAVLAEAGLVQVGDGPGAPVRTLVVSDEVGVRKPDPAIFAFALADLPGVEPERVAYVGDSVLNDVQGARAAGLHPIHLDPFDDHAGAGWDHDRIRTLDEVLAFV